VAIQRADQRQRFVDRLGLAFARPLEASATVTPAFGVGHLGVLFGIGRVGFVAVAEQGAVEVSEQVLDMTVLTRRGVVEHDFVGVAVQRPEVALVHLALALAPGLDRRFVHRQHPA